MQYWIFIETDDDDLIRYEGAVTAPSRVLPLLKSSWVDKNYPHWCKECGLDCHCHPIAEDGSKYCTVLFHDAVKPEWRIEDVV